MLTHLLAVWLQSGSEEVGLHAVDLHRKIHAQDLIQIFYFIDKVCKAYF